MTEWISTIDSWLRRNNPDYYLDLRPGATQQQIEAAERRLGLQLPEALRQLYMWRDGQPNNCYGSFYYNFMFPQLETAVASAETMNNNFEEGEVPDDWWLPSWFPFLDNGAADMICVDTAGAFGGIVGQVLWFMHETPDRNIEYPSVEAWGSTFALSLERGLWQPSDYGYFPVDSRNPDASDTLDELRRELYPGYPWGATAGA